MRRVGDRFVPLRGLWVATGIVLLSLAPLVLFGQDNPVLNLDVQCLPGTNNVCIVRLTLKNNGEMPFSISSTAVPWGSRYSLLLLASRTDPRSAPLQPDIVIDDPRDDKTQTLRPGESLTGEIVLNHRFRDFDDIIRNNDIAVFWLYEVKSRLLDKPLRFLGGWLLVSKRGPSGKRDHVSKDDSAEKPIAEDAS
jgi:hypothetical protein